MTPSEFDPAVEAARNIENQHQLENQKRADIAQMISNESVPSYEQLVEANRWAADIRTAGTFDDDNNLVQEPGLLPINKEDLTRVESYFDKKRWILSGPELDLAREVAYHPGNRSFGEIVGKHSIVLAEKISSEFANVGTLRKLDKIAEIKGDFAALISLNSSIRKAAEQRGVSLPESESEIKTQRTKAEIENSDRLATEKSEQLIKAGLPGIDVDLALAEINKATDEGRELDLIGDTILGLSHKQKDSLLEYYGYKPVVAPETIDPRTLAPEPSKKEHFRRLINGSQTKPKVAARHRLEAKAKLAERKLAADDKLPDGHRLKLSGVERSLLERSAEKPLAKIRKGSRLNSEKYGSQTRAKAIEEKESIYSTANVRAALEKLKADRQEIDAERLDILKVSQSSPFSLLEKKIMNAIQRENSEKPKKSSFDIVLSDDEFTVVLEAIDQRYNVLLEREVQSLSKGERVKNYQLDDIYINAQLAVAREITDAYFDTQGLSKEDGTYDAYVRGVLEAFHSYKPKTESDDSAQEYDSKQKTTQKEKKTERVTRETISRTSKRERTEQERRAGESLDNLHNIIND